MSKSRILVQLDVDSHASVFDAVVAVEAGAEHLLTRGGVQPDDVRDLVHGAMFTRGPKNLRYTAISVGGSNVQAAEQVFRAVTECFFGPMRVSILFDANGSNTTAAAAVLVAATKVNLADCPVTVLGATGPVGQRAVRLLALEGAQVRVASRSQTRAENVCREVKKRYPTARLTPCATSTADELAAAVQGAHVLVAAGAAGVELVTNELFGRLDELQIAIDLNAVPPVGISAIEPVDAGVERSGVTCYGALGVGGLKMKIHKAALRSLFTANDLVLEAEEVYQIGRDLDR